MRERSNFAFRMTDIARKVRMTIGEDHIANDGGVRPILRILRRRFAPDAIDAMYHDAAEFMNFKRTDLTTDAYLIEIHVLRGTAEARKVMGSGVPDEFVPILCMQNAPPLKHGKSLALARIGRPNANEVSLACAETRRVKMSFCPPIWMPYLENKIMPPGWHIVEQKGRKE